MKKNLIKINKNLFFYFSSSRFGKYLEIHFSPNGNVLGGNIK